MKKILCLFISLILMLVSVTVFADTDDAPFILEITPAETNEFVLSSENKSKVNITIKPRNGSTFGKDFTVQEIIYGPSAKKVDNSNVSLGRNERNYSVIENQNIVFPSSVSSGSTVEFTAKWYFESPTEDHVVKYKITLTDPDPNATVKVESNKTSVAPGGKIKLTYEVHNSGNVPLNSVTVTDKEVSALTSKSSVYKADKNTVLGVGESVSTVVEVSPTEKLTLSPVVSYVYDGRSKEKKGTTQTILVEDAVPYVSLECNTYAVSKSGEEVTFTYKVRNESQSALKNVKIYDSDTSDATVVNGPLSLDPNNECNGTYKLKINKSGFYKIKVVYSYDGSDGEKEISAKTEKAIRLPDEVKLNISSISPEKLTSAGVINFKLKLENTAVSDITDVYISEENNLAQRTLFAETVPAQSASSTVEKEIAVNIPSDGTEVKFLLTYTLDGENYSVSLLYRVIFGAPLETPVPTENAEPTATATVDPGKSNGGTILWIVLGVLLLVLIGGAIFFLVRIKKNENTNYNNDDEYFDDDYNDGYNDGYDDGNYDDGYDNFGNSYVSDDDEIDEEGVKIYRK